MLEKVKLALRIVTDEFDTELSDLIDAAKADIRVAGISEDALNSPEAYPLVNRAIITYCRLFFGEPSDFERLKISYDEQKAQMKTNSEYNGRSECCG